MPQDGHDKQDGEHAAAKRWLEALQSNSVEVLKLGVALKTRLG